MSQFLRFSSEIISISLYYITTNNKHNIELWGIFLFRPCIFGAMTLLNTLFSPIPRHKSAPRETKREDGKVMTLEEIDNIADLRV